MSRVLDATAVPGTTFDRGHLRRLILKAAALTVTLVLAATVSGRIQRRPSVPVATTPDNQCWTYKPTEKGFARRINEARLRAGQRKLSIDPELSKVARVHTREMVTKDLLHHTTETDLRRWVRNWDSLGENVGVGGTVDSLHIAFMNSPAHRHNVLYPSFRHSGVGVIEANGRMWVTVLFEASIDPGTTLSMPRCSR